LQVDRDGGLNGKPAEIYPAQEPVGTGTDDLRSAETSLVERPISAVIAMSLCLM